MNKGKIFKKYIVVQHPESDCMFVDLLENWDNGVLNTHELDLLEDFDTLEDANDYGEREAKIRGCSFEPSKDI